MKTLVVGGDNSRLLAKSVAKRIKAPYSELSVDHFPDGELRIRFTDDVAGMHVIIINSLLPNPNESLM